METAPISFETFASCERLILYFKTALFYCYKYSRKVTAFPISINSSTAKIAKKFAHMRLTCFLFCNQVDNAKGKDQNSPPNAPNSAIVGISSRSPLPPKTGPSTGMKKVKQAMQCKAVAEKMG